MRKGVKSKSKIGESGEQEQLMANRELKQN